MSQATPALATSTRSSSVRLRSGCTTRSSPQTVQRVRSRSSISSPRARNSPGRLTKGTQWQRHSYLEKKSKTSLGTLDQKMVLDRKVLYQNHLLIRSERFAGRLV